MVASFQLTINKRQGQNQYYEEPLAEGIPLLEMMRIPSGTFLMGSPEGELERLSAEGPQHEVAIPQFFIARYPITQAQWRVVAAMPQINHELKLEPSNFKGERLPVEQVSWYEAVEFCDRLTIHTNRQYRLPTESEWEYACCAGMETPFHFGETISTDLANYCGKDRGTYSGSYGFGSKGEYRQETTPVDQFGIVNAFGLCEMHGNVMEWCHDHWHETYIDALTDGSAWLTNDETAGRLLRGGSWSSSPAYCRSRMRNFNTPDYRLNTIGFRVSCSAARRKVYAISSKSTSEERLKQIAAVTAEKRTSLTIEEARELSKRALRFKQEKGRIPSLVAADPWEKRMAEGIAFLQSKVKEDKDA